MIKVHRVMLPILKKKAAKRQNLKRRMVMQSEQQKTRKEMKTVKNIIWLIRGMSAKC